MIIKNLAVGCRAILLVPSLFGPMIYLQLLCNRNILALRGVSRYCWAHSNRKSAVVSVLSTLARDPDRLSLLYKTHAGTNIRTLKYDLARILLSIQILNYEVENEIRSRLILCGFLGISISLKQVA